MPIERQKIPGLGTIFTKKASFSTTDTTLEVSADGFGRVAVVSIVHHGDYGDNDHIEIDETSDANGVITVPASDSITLQRQASGTTGLTVSVWMVGY